MEGQSTLQVQGRRRENSCLDVNLLLVDESYEVGSAEDGTMLLEVKRQVVARLTLAHVTV